MTKSIGTILAFGAKKFSMSPFSTRGTQQKWISFVPSPRITFMARFCLREMWLAVFICRCYKTGLWMSLLQTMVMISFINRRCSTSLETHCAGLSWWQSAGEMDQACWWWRQCNVKTVSTFTWPNSLRFFSLEIREELDLCPPFSCKWKQAQTKNHYRTGQCVWEELDYRLEYSRISSCAHIKCLWNLSWNLRAFKLLV